MTTTTYTQKVSVSGETVEALLSKPGSIYVSSDGYQVLLSKHGHLYVSSVVLSVLLENGEEVVPLNSRYRTTINFIG